eukprot:5597740-Pyramimonas_sp.AAC.1
MPAKPAHAETLDAKGQRLLAAERKTVAAMHEAAASKDEARCPGPRSGSRGGPGHARSHQRKEGLRCG